jgi:hypothetical protein
MFYKCTKVQHKPIIIQVWDQKKPSVLCSGAPDCPVCHRIVSGAPGPYRVQAVTLRFQQAHSAIIHRTVRCANGLSGVPTDCPVCQRTVRCANGATTNSRKGRLQKPLTEEQCAQSQSRRVRGAPDSEQDLSGVAADCPVPHEDKASNDQPSSRP